MEQVMWKERQKQRARKWIRAILTYCFKVELRGTYQPESNSVIIANRTSKIDLLLLAAFLPEQLTVAFPPRSAGKLWMKMMMLFADVIVIDSTNAFAARALVKAIREGKRCVIFPQGIGLQEESLKVFDAPGMVLQKAGASVIPIRIDGAQHSIFSISKDKHLTRLFPKIILHVLPTQSYIREENASLDRNAMSTRLFQLISELTFANSYQPMSMFEALIQGTLLGTKNKAKIEDANRAPLTSKQFLARCFILGRQIKNQTQVGEHVGIMLPTTIAGMVTFFALHAYRRIPAMLNFSLGLHNLLATCNVAEVKTIYTARQFIDSAKLESIVEGLENAGIKIYFLEDFKSSIKLGHKLSGIFKGMFPSRSYKLIGDPVSSEDPGVILFTSGSEGLPKGVVLTHSNLLANCCQLTSRVDFSSHDKFFNALPIFHCFGLTTGSILPLIQGISCFFYPSPLHYKIIPGLIYQTAATIMLGTDTFLTGYARVAERHDFSSVRYIFAGAEKVKPETIRHWIDTFGVKVYEGYGATEAAPVISMNCPLASIPGSVGMLLPSMESRIQPVDGIAEGGRLILRGPNIMKGYLSSEKPGALITSEDGWHDTGDIVTMNEEGFITIAGRAKRFAKIAGEMVSLTAVEGVAASIWPELLHAAVSKKSEKKGEQIILYSEAENADKMSFVKRIKDLNYSELLIPHEIVSGSKIPVLPSGKIDYLTIENELIQA
ncbi:fused 2-acylglycerophospho-ethanolamine acyl transferase, acyl-acyl carrier protein synthetase [Fluoribacter gormanii]|uniref:Acyl-[acyl-carrier-protein]-phospholipid O-acyltransferase / long-chain-fatty-acid--[acyl-carrier-protein] ligase n=2 Tax=Fluoribacter gormanii TaxID=464 RepID=A0A377GMF3_9GAMM|nr:fused 2-acylglycerophospho-ethanolamine acyl transferase, acyl-acyl carrier protein synthetase [Fluoribacter gormanii]SIQ67789.1 acyl-[acyl-carrier-protein]-phospholipid O-acyltransferase / long-chain-fatty-acid--[acyl-carrier-protein] ligase [Fluoribacter gormanii]STO25773.1 Bifunctional protein aas [Fluoribacter gormanii]